MAKKYELKTKVTEASVDDYLSAIINETRREDCEWLTKLLSRITRKAPKMWGPSIVGFDSYHYQYDSGHEGDMCLIGFSSRAAGITLYLMGDFPKRDELLAKLGKHTTSKACLYIKRLADVDKKVLEKLIAASYAAAKTKHG